MKLIPFNAAILAVLSLLAGQPVSIGVPGYTRGAVLFQDDFDSPDSLKRWINYGDAKYVPQVTNFANNNGTYGIAGGRSPQPTIYDTRGRKVAVLKGAETIWRPGGLPAGLYFLKASTGEGVIVKPVMVVQ